VKFLITLQSQKISFFCALAKYLFSIKHQIYFSFISKDVHSIVAQNIEPFYKYEISKHKTTKFDNRDLLKEALNYEKKYNLNFSYIISQDRALGRGHIINATSIPKIKRSSWSKEKKIEEILSKFYYYEDLLDRVKPDVILSIIQKEILDIVAKKRNIPYYALVDAKFEDRYRWNDTVATSNIFLKSITKNLTKANSELSDFNKNLSHPDWAYVLHSRVKYSYLEGFKGFVITFLKEIYKNIRGSNKKNSYVFPGWATSNLKRPYIYSYISKIGKKIEDLNDQKIFYIPLQLEPEISLLSISPEFTNQFEMISWISKSLPANYTIVVREQANAFGSRPKWYYKKLQEMGNVVFSHPKTLGIDWIRKSNFVGTITGTAALEGVLLEKSVLSFGKHQAVNLLPTVKYCTNYESTLKSFEELVNTDKQKFIFSKKVLYNSILNSSFSLKNFEVITNSEIAVAGNKFSEAVKELAIQCGEKLIDELKNINNKHEKNK